MSDLAHPLNVTVERLEVEFANGWVAYDGRAEFRSDLPGGGRDDGKVLVRFNVDGTFNAVDVEISAATGDVNALGRAIEVLTVARDALVTSSGNHPTNRGRCLRLAPDDDGRGRCTELADHDGDCEVRP